MSATPGDAEWDEKELAELFESPSLTHKPKTVSSSKQSFNKSTNQDEDVMALFEPLSSTPKWTPEGDDGAESEYVEGEEERGTPRTHQSSFGGRLRSFGVLACNGDYMSLVMSSIVSLLGDWLTFIASVSL